MLSHMARTCIFCGGTKMSAEHIWPQWAARRVAHTGVHAVRSYAHIEGQLPLEHQSDQRAYELKAKVVCEVCNNGWMSKIEEAAKPYFETMLSGRGREIHKQAQRTLATWALKTSIVWTASQAKQRSVVPAADLDHLRNHREPSANVSVWIVSYDGSHPAVADAYGIAANHKDDGTPYSIWATTVGFGPVAFHLFGSTVPGMGLESSRLAPWINPIWPIDKTFIWRTRPCCSNEELKAWMDGILRQFESLGVHTLAS